MSNVWQEGISNHFHPPLSNHLSLQSVLKEVIKLIKKEMKVICSESHDSILRDCNEGIRFFKWERLFKEMCDQMPTLTTLLLSLVSGKDDTKRIILVCVLSCILLKNRF